MRVTRYPKIRARLSHALAGRLINDIRELAVRIEDLPQIDLSKDPNDNYLLALASAGDADYLVSGDRSDLLDIKRFGRTRIVTVRQFASLIG